MLSSNFAFVVLEYFDVESDFSLDLWANRLFRNFHNVFEWHTPRLSLNKHQIKWNRTNEIDFPTTAIRQWTADLLIVIKHCYCRCSSADIIVIEIDFFAAFIFFNIRIASSCKRSIVIVDIIIVDTRHGRQIKSSVIVRRWNTFEIKKQILFVRWLFLFDIRGIFLSAVPSLDEAMFDYKTKVKI